MLGVRTLAIGVALFALAVAGCGGDDNGGGGGGGASGGGDKTAKVAFVYPTTTTNFAQEMALGAKAAADDTPGVQLTESAPRRGRRAQAGAALPGRRRARPRTAWR